MALVRGPFNLKWGDNVIEDVEELDLDPDFTSDDFETLQGNIYELDGPIKIAATITLLKSDIPALAAIVPQYFVANGGTLSTGETVNHAEGAIDVQAASCDDTIHNNLDVISCGNPANVLRIVNARTRFDDIDIDNKVQKVMIRFIGEPEGGAGALQMFREGTVAVVS